MEKYCMYLRKSRSDRDLATQSMEETLARHETTLKALADHLHLNIETIYKEVVSGDSIAARPVMQKLLEEVERGIWTGVLVMEVERLARGDTIDQGIVSQAFKYSGTKIITPSKIYDPENEFDEEYFEFGLFMSRREYKTINRRLQRGRIASVNEGKFIGSAAPYGYVKVKIPNEKGYTLKIDDEKAEVVRMIFNLYCKGELREDGTQMRMGCDGIAKRLDQLGVKPPAKEKWSKASIADMLSNPTYAGMIRFGYDKEEKIVEKNSIKKVRHRNKECRIVKGLHAPIVSLELFEEASNIRKANTKNTIPANYTLQNPLAGIVYCKKCGSLMTRLGPNPKNRYSTLRCSNRYCDNISAPIFLVEKRILDFLADWVKKYEVNTEVITATPFDTEIGVRTEALERVAREIGSLRDQLNNVYNLLEQGVYSIDLFRQREKIIKENISELEKQYSKLEEETQKYEQLKLSRERYVPRVEHLLATYNTNTPEANNVILKELIERVDYLKETRNKRGGVNNSNFMLEIFPRVSSV